MNFLMAIKNPSNKLNIGIIIVTRIRIAANPNNSGAPAGCANFFSKMHISFLLYSISFGPFYIFSIDVSALVLYSWMICPIACDAFCCLPWWRRTCITIFGDVDWCSVAFVCDSVIHPITSCCSLYHCQLACWAKKITLRRFHPFTIFLKCSRRCLSA
jgi:hypothetical protein